MLRLRSLIYLLVQLLLHVSHSAAQVDWRLACYGDFPYSWAQLKHPRASDAHKDNLVTIFFSLKPCCRDKFHSDRVHKHFKTWQALRSSKTFENGVYAFASTFRFTNVWSEQLLARIRKSHDGNDCDVERVVSTGFLTQALSEHALRGGDDPRWPTRQQLLDDGVPLRCARPKSYTRPQGPFVCFMNKEDAARKARGDRMNKAEYSDWRRLKYIEFMTLPDLSRQRYALDAKAAHVDKLMDKQTFDNNASVSDGRVLRSVVDAVGSKRSPYKPDVFQQTLRRTIGIQHGEAYPTFAHYAPLLRLEQQRRIFIRDTGAASTHTAYP